MLGSSLLISALFTLSHAANLVEVLTKHGATKLVDLAVKAGLADTLTGDHNKLVVRQSRRETFRHNALTFCVLNTPK